VSLITGVIVAIAKSPLTIGDVFAVALALIPTGWGLLCVSSIYIHFSGVPLLIICTSFLFILFLNRSLAN
jgi:hypothetical protein